MGLFSNNSWGANSKSQKGWKSAKEAKAEADKRNKVNQTEFARRKAAAEKRSKK